jgi:replicative DNA helicase
VALDALIDTYTQNLTISLLDKYLDKLPQYDTDEIKENLANIVLNLDEKTLTTEGVYTMSDILLFRDADEVARERIPLGLNNTFDAIVRTCRQEYVLIGGKRGSGKSLTAANVLTNQYEMGNTAVYFTIEMSGYETLQRTMSILANVNHQRLKQEKLTDEELLQVIKARAGMYVDSDDLVQKFIKDKNKYKFEEALVSTKELKPDNQMIIIDDRNLGLTTIDVQVSKLKAKFGDKLTVVVIDYINQIRVEGSANYDWQPQVAVSTKLKELARKYDVLVVSPYQIDATGEARFAKGILDAADISLVLTAHDKEDSAITFETTKIRGAAEMTFTSPMNWETLRVSPHSMERPTKQEKTDKVSRNKKKQEKEDEGADDLPWQT